MKLFNNKFELPLLPLKDIVAFPQMVVPFFVERQRSLRAIEEARSQDHTVFLATQKNAQDNPTEADVYKVGVVAKILQVVKMPDETIRILAEASERAWIVKYLRSEDFFRVQVRKFQEDQRITSHISALMRTIQKEFTTYSSLYPKFPDEIINSIEHAQTPNKLINLVCANVPFKTGQKIEFLTESKNEVRLEKLATSLSTEIEMLELQHKIDSKVKQKLERTQKEYYLNEQLREIQRELGKEADDPTGTHELMERLEKKNLPSDVKEKCTGELKRLTRLQPISPESAVLRTYIEWITDIPWHETTRDKKDITSAQRILDEDHYNLKHVKERILDFIAVRLLKGKAKGPILCFVGPPGTGKTSLGKSVARCLGRRFVRISLGGIKDEAEIRGHRKTYVGALPGKIIQSMRKAGTRNPVFLLDEIDKMSSDFRGDPSSALLEVLDPEQNSTFMDHYLEVQYDLSDVLFITTANSIHNIPYALRDRMEIIQISGYTEFEKEKIAGQFLIPKQMTENGLEWANIKFSRAAILKIIRNYTLEAGVRNLEREIASIFRKIARKAIKRGIQANTSQAIKKKFSIVVTEKSVEKYLEQEKFQDTGVPKDYKPGLAYGLAWTELGGTLLPIEVAMIDGNSEIHMTGSLGDVMKESAQTALSFIRAHAHTFEISANFIKDTDIHIHVPEGAIPKDGPSAGITIAAALLSAVKSVSLKKGYCMTGEITLTGRMLAIGGVKEKILAAHRHKMNHVIMPLHNKKDLQELPKEVLSALTITFSESVFEALHEIIPSE